MYVHYISSMTVNNSLILKQLTELFLTKDIMQNPCKRSIISIQTSAESDMNDDH